MTESSKRGPGEKPQVEKLELNKETVQDLSESEAEAARGAMGATDSPNCTQTATQDPRLCHSNKTFCMTQCAGICRSDGPCGTLNCGGQAAIRARRRRGP